MDFRERVRQYLKGGSRYEQDRGFRAGLFATVQNSEFYEFTTTKTNAGTRVIIAGGDDDPGEFVLAFGLRADRTKDVITKWDLEADDIIARIKGDERHHLMTRTSATQMYNQAAGRPEEDS